MHAVAAPFVAVVGIRWIAAPPEPPVLQTSRRISMGHHQPALDAKTEYHLGELAIALNPSRPEYIMPALGSARVGVVDVGCGMGQLFVAKAG